MTSPQDFLLCFDGFRAAIDEAPSESQWGRLCAERAKVETSPDPRAPAAAILLAPSPIPVEQLTVSPRAAASWKEAFKTALIQNGLDPETAAQLTDKEPVSLAIDPVQAAQAAFSND